MTSGNQHVETEAAPSRFLVGIDLGTTNSAVSYVDTNQATWQVRTFAITQLVDAGQVETLDTLPSFHYQPLEDELSAGTMRLPWDEEDAAFVVGRYAREQGTRLPGRLITSAKSWLCHAGVDRTADLLPWQAGEEVRRFSPVAVSGCFLRHIRQAWDARHPGEPLAEQDLILTLPASFDEVARELTVQAAAMAGLPRVVLIEEPQAAFYAWIDSHQDDWEQHVRPGQKILVCDIGGGTSDFTLIRVRRGEGDTIQFHRVAVGDHLILGGDNMDLALARHLETELGERLQPHQWDVLVRTCRRVKEDVLGDAANDELAFNLPGTGAKLIGGGLRVEVDRTQAREALLGGFFPVCDLDDKPHREQSGFQEFGLPYASDPAVTRYLAAFLATHRHAGDDMSSVGTLERGATEDADWPQGRAGGHDPARPDIVLFNGGVFASSAIQQRLLAALESWFRTLDPQWSPQVLDNQRLDLAVSRGAAYYGTVRRGRGVRIAAALARTYYIGIAGQESRAVCLVPGNAEPGQEIDLTELQFDLLVHQPVEFPLFVSSTRLSDRPGELVALDLEQMKPLPPIRTALKTRGKRQAAHISVQLHARLTEIGTLDLWCSEVETERRWRLQFDVRTATETDRTATETRGEAEGVVEESAWESCQTAIAETFQPGGDGKPSELVKRLVAALDMDRWDWPMSLLRRIWESLLEFQEGRRKSAQHETRWLNLLGFSLRPGYGMAVDDWRVAETWRLIQGKLAFDTIAGRTESWVLWRRLGGGLTVGQQQAIADPLLSTSRGLLRRITTGKGGGDVSFSPQQSVEMWRLLGSLELLPAPTKIELGEMLVQLMDKKSLRPSRAAMVWALGRIGSRTPLYGPLNTTVAVDTAQRWLASLLRRRESSDADRLAVMQLARRTGDRYRDLGDKMRQQVLEWMAGQDASVHLVELVRDGGSLDQEEQGRIFGEALPKGLRLRDVG